MKNPKGPKAVKNNGKYLSLHTYWRLPRKIKKELTIGAFSRNIHPMSILSTISTCKVTQRISYTHRNTRAARKLEKLVQMKNPKGPKAVKINGKYLSLHTYWRLPRKIKKELTIGAFSRNIHPMSILSTISTCKVTQRISYTHRNTRAARKLEKLVRHEERITHERMQRDIIRNISSRFRSL
jgi:hypothetical protein